MYPVATILGRGLVPSGELDLSPLREVRARPRAPPHRVVHGVAGRAVDGPHRRWSRCPARTCSPRFEFRGRRVVRALVTVPFVLPTVVVGDRVPRAVRPGGPLAFLGLATGRLAAMLVAHVFFNFAVVVRTVGGLWAHLDPRQEEAARMLGASVGGVRSARVTLPLLRPPIVAGGVDRVPLHVHVVRRDRCCSAGRGCRRSRSRSTARRCSSSTCRSRGAARHRAARRRGRAADRATRACRSRTTHDASVSGPRRDARHAAHPAAERALLAGDLAVMARTARRAARSSSSSGRSHARRVRARLLPRARRHRSGQHAVRAAHRRGARTRCSSRRSRPCSRSSSAAAPRSRSPAAATRPRALDAR